MQEETYDFQPDELEFSISALSPKNEIKIRKQSIIDLIKHCLHAEARYYLARMEGEVRKSEEEGAVSTVLKEIVQIIKAKATEPGLKEIKFYALICLVALSKFQESRLCVTDISHIILALVDFIHEVVKQQLELQNHTERRISIAPVRDELEKLFLKYDDEPCYTKFDILEWTSKITEFDLAVTILINFLCEASDNVEEAKEHKRIKSVQEVFLMKGGSSFRVILECLSHFIFVWMSSMNAKDFSIIWRIGNIYHLVSRCVSQNEGSKAVVAKLFSRSSAFKETFDLLDWCNGWLMRNDKVQEESIVIDCSLAIVRALVDLTDNCSSTCDSLGAKELSLLLNMLVFSAKEYNEATCATLGKSRIAQKHSHHWRFDFTLVLLSLLINCTEENAQNRKTLGTLKNKRACNLIVDIFVSTLPDEVVKALKDGKRSQSEEIEFGWDPEKLVVSSYSALLLGCLMRRNQTNKLRILHHIPGNSPVILIHVLRASVSFQKDAQVLSKEALEATSRIISEFESLLTIKGTNKSVELIKENKRNLQEAKAYFEDESGEKSRDLTLKKQSTAKVVQEKGRKNKRLKSSSENFLIQMEDILG